MTPLVLVSLLASASCDHAPVFTVFSPHPQHTTHTAPQYPAPAPAPACETVEEEQCHTTYEEVCEQPEPTTQEVCVEVEEQSCVAKDVEVCFSVEETSCETEESEACIKTTEVTCRQVDTELQTTQCAESQKRYLKPRTVKRGQRIQPGRTFFQLILLLNQRLKTNYLVSFSVLS